MEWFGRHWGAPVNENTEHTATPLGVPCFLCKVPIKYGDQGVVLPYCSSGASALVPEHLKCFLESVLGPNAEELLKKGESDG